MSPSDKDDASLKSDSKEEFQNQKDVSSKEPDTSVADAPSCSAESISSEHGTITNIPSFTANPSTLKCSVNDQMKTFDPGETNEKMLSKNCGYSLSFPMKNINSVTKNKNYKAGSKINKLADMLAKRSQNIVEMTQNVISDVISDITSAPKVDGICTNVEVSNNTGAEEKIGISDVCCKKTAINYEVCSTNESPIKYLECENYTNSIEQFQIQSNFSESYSCKETSNSELNALTKNLILPETDSSTKSEKKCRKNLEKVELSHILPEKRRCSPRKKLLNCKLLKESSYNNCLLKENSDIRTGAGDDKFGLAVSERDKNISNNCNADRTLRTKSGKHSKSKKLVETSTQTITTDFTDIEMESLMITKDDVTLESSSEEILESKGVEEEMECEPSSKVECKTITENESKDSELKLKEVNSQESVKCMYACMYCPESFITKEVCKNHEKSHSPTKSRKVRKCQFCTKQCPSAHDFKLHCIKNHPIKYALCIKCDQRFCEKNQLYSHNRSHHLTKAMQDAQHYVKIQETVGISPKEKNKDEEKAETKKPADKKAVKPGGIKSDLKVDVSFDGVKKSTTSPRTAQKVSPRDNKTEEQLLEMEMLFYSHLSGNIKENLANHLDGKIDKNGNPIPTDSFTDSSENSPSKIKTNNLLCVVTPSNSGTVMDRAARAPSPYQTRSKTPNPLPPTAKKFKKLPNWQQKFWEKYNFPTNYRYEHRFWDKNYLDAEKSALYLKDLSCLDIKTQLIMRENIKKLDCMKCDEYNKLSDKLSFPEYLSLVPRVFRGQENGEQIMDCLKGKNESVKDEVSTANLDLGKLRRKTSADNSILRRQLEKNTSKTLDGNKMLTRRQSVIELNKVSKKGEDTIKKRKGSLDMTSNQKMTLRRQTSLDNLQKICESEGIAKTDKLSDSFSEVNLGSMDSEENSSSTFTGITEISGEWVRPRSYLCGTCCTKFNNLWELEDHKWVSHPNVWCTHYEFEDEKIDKLFNRSDSEAGDGTGSSGNPHLSKLKLTDIYKRYLLPHGSLKTAKLVPNMSFPEQCTKCKKNCMNAADMHKHMLDCGGDTTWFLTMYSSPMTIKRKWRPFGSRRKKQIGRRMVKRNIPNTPTIRPYHYQHRIKSKPGDVESIQKMLANLPEKRARRAINFDEIKTRSQATIHSNRLLRKRFKVSFGTNMMRFKALKQQRQAKSVKKENCSKSTTDTSSESTPTGSPKRRNKIKDSIPPLKEELLHMEKIPETISEDNRMPKKKMMKQNKKLESVSVQDIPKKQPKRENKTLSRSNDKPFTRSSAVGNVNKESVHVNKNKKGKFMQKVETVKPSECKNLNEIDTNEERKILKTIKQVKLPKKKTLHNITGNPRKQDLESSGADNMLSSHKVVEYVNIQKKLKTENREEKLRISSGTEESLPINMDYKRGSEVNLSNEHLRLKTNDKEKTELIKRIRKTLRNSKKILEKRESKEKSERRRSLRIRILQSVDVNPGSVNDECNIEKMECKETLSDVNLSKSPQLTFEKDDLPPMKDVSKVGKSTKSLDSCNALKHSVHGDTFTGRRSNRIMSATLPNEKANLCIKNPVTFSLPERNAEDINRKIRNSTDKLNEIIERGSRNENPEDSAVVDNDPRRMEFESQSVRKLRRLHGSGYIREVGLATPTSKTCLKTDKGSSLNQDLDKVGIAYKSKNSDLSEMPVLDKEEPVHGRVTRQADSEIPVLMPFENEVKKNKGNTVKRKNISVTRKVVKKRRDSIELKEGPAPENTLIQENGRSKRDREVVETNAVVGSFMNRRRKNCMNDYIAKKNTLPQTPEDKKYFLGICPNEIDKGGDLKDESGSDSEPLITLVLNQKCKGEAENESRLELQDRIAESTYSDVTNDHNKIKPSSLHDKLNASHVETQAEACNSDGMDKITFSDPELISSVIYWKGDTPDVHISGNEDAGSENLLNQKAEVTLKPNGNMPNSKNMDPTNNTADSSLLNDLEVKRSPSKKKCVKGLKMTVKLKETAIITGPAASCDASIPIDRGLISRGIEQNKDKSSSDITRNNFSSAGDGTKIERRSRRVSKEIKSSNEFIIDDPLILVDELWSDLDSDSDSNKRRSKRGKKKTPKKKCNEDKKDSIIDLEKLLQNFGERKDLAAKDDAKQFPKTMQKIRKPRLSHLDKRKRLENHLKLDCKSCKRLSLRLFKFNRKFENFGRLGQSLINVKTRITNLRKNIAESKAGILTLPFLAAEIKENPVQIIKCGVQKIKSSKKTSRKSTCKSNSNIQLKISLPLENINSLSVLNNNNLTNVICPGNSNNFSTCTTEEFMNSKNKKQDSCYVEEPLISRETSDSIESAEKYEEPVDWEDAKSKSRRSDIIDKIFYCEICKTYYYSPSQLKIHKLSNRHKLKETSLLQSLSPPDDRPVIKVLNKSEDLEKEPQMELIQLKPQNDESAKPPQCSEIDTIDPEKMNDDTSEMPILEGPFIENPFVRLGMDSTGPPRKPSPPPSVLGFTDDCLKDIQKAIGCTDEEMLILTLLGENSIEIENEILDLDSCKLVSSGPTVLKSDNQNDIKDTESSNGLHKADFKKRITSALARLVNKAVLNLLQKYKNTNRTSISSEAVSFLIKLSRMNDKKNLMELDELLKNKSEGEPSNRIVPGENDKPETFSPYKYLCTICGNRFENESSREFHTLRSHKPNLAINADEPAQGPVMPEHDKEMAIPYMYLYNMCGSRLQRDSLITKGRSNLDDNLSIHNLVREDDKKEINIPYKYLCTICGSRFQKESMWECHRKRSHKIKAKKITDEHQISQTTYEDDWSNTWTYDINDDLPGSVETPQFLCSDCGINFTSPKEVLDHQKLEHAGQKDSDICESGPLQSSTIGSSDEIVKGRKTCRRGPKHLTKAELDQQRIIAKNELRKLDRKPTNKNKCNKVKWGVDAMKFTTEKENKAIHEEIDKGTSLEDSLKPRVDLKTADNVPKLNLFRTSNIPEFKVQKTSCLNRFQRILDNKLKRQNTKSEAKLIEDKSTVEKELIEPLSVIKKERKRRSNKCSSKKVETRKMIDVYDFNDSESEPEPITFSHIKKGCLAQSPTRLKLVKVTEADETSKKKADSTTKDLLAEDYDSEDSLPLSMVKRSKTDDKCRINETIEKPEGILEQVEYLIEQLENETNQPSSEAEKDENTEKGASKDDVRDLKMTQKKVKTKRKFDSECAMTKSANSITEASRVSLDQKYFLTDDISPKNNIENELVIMEDTQKISVEDDSKVQNTITETPDNIFPTVDSSRGVSDVEDSLPLVLMSKKNDMTPFRPEHTHIDPKKTYEAKSLQDIGSPNSFGILSKGEKLFDISDNLAESPKNLLDSLPSYAVNENEVHSKQMEKSCDTLNGNVIYQKNDSLSGFDSDLSEFEDNRINKNRVIDNQSTTTNEELIKEVMEREDVVIVCSKKEQDFTKTTRRKSRELPKRRKQVSESMQKKKKILPLLSVTLEKSNFRKSSESPILKKDEIVKKIWSRRRFCDDVPEEITDISSNSRDSVVKNINEESHIEIHKELIVKKIWNKKRLENENESEFSGTKLSEKSEDIKINQTEISNEVVIKCGPKVKSKRRKGRVLSKESSKERIMRKIWSGKCAFQTKAALKTYDTDTLCGAKDLEVLDENQTGKKRGRPPNFVDSKKTKNISDGERTDDEDDLDSLLEEIEREEVEKAIRLEFLQLRRSDKANVEISKESGSTTLGLFAESCLKQGRDVMDRRRKRVRKNLKHPRKNLLKRRKFIKKPTAKPQQQIESDGTAEDSNVINRIADTSEVRFNYGGQPDFSSSGPNMKIFDLETKMKSRKHKKHRHKHHHHKHKHKKSKHHKYMLGKHKLKHKSAESTKDKLEDIENFTLLEKMCQDIPSQVDQKSQDKFECEFDSIDTKLDEILMSTSSSVSVRANGTSDMSPGEHVLEKDIKYSGDNRNVYEFVEDDSSFIYGSKVGHKN